jgi:hypothetical protein
VLTLNSPPGAPIGANLGVQYTCNDSRGAVLLARGPITCSSLKALDVDGMVSWVNKNMGIIIKKGEWDSIRKRGIWVITETQYTSECAKTVFQGKNSTKAFHAGANVPNVVTSKASAAWWDSGNTSSGWIIHRVSIKFYMSEVERRIL